MQTKFFQWMLAAILICGLGVFTSCSSDSDDSWTSDAGIALIAKNGKIDYWRQIETAFTDACEKKGLEAYCYSTTAESAYQEQLAAVADLRLIDSKALKGIVFAPCYGPNGESAEEAVAALAKERGIPVIIIDSPVKADSPLASYPYYGTDNTDAGKKMAAQVPTADRVAVFAMKNTPGIERAKAFKGLRPNAVVYEVGEKATKEVEQAIMSDQFDDFVFFNGSILVDVIPVIKISSVINVYTFDVYGEFLDELIEGKKFFKGIMAQNTFDMASKAVDAVVANSKQSETVPTTYINQYNLTDPSVQPFLAFYDKKVPVIDNIVEKLSGKWITGSTEDEMLTSDKIVFTFLSATEATVSYSEEDFEETESGTKRKWSNHRKYSVAIYGNKVVLTGHPNETITLVDELVIKSITDKEMICLCKHTTYRYDEIVSYVETDYKMTKLNVDYSNDIYGKWEGTVNNSGTLQTWRWEFKEDGTYVFSMKSGDNPWQTYEDELAEYFVDGTLLCMRWKGVGAEKEERDWREIVSINGNKMLWYLYVQDDSGNPYSKNVELTRVE